MAIAAAANWFSVLTSAGTSRYSLSSQRIFSTSRRSTRLLVPVSAEQKKRTPRKSNPRKPSTETEAIVQKSNPGRLKDESVYSSANGNSSRSKTGRAQSTAFKSFGMESKDKKGFLVDSKEQQVEAAKLQDAAFLNAVVKVYCTHTAPDYSLPWQKQKQFTSTGSAFMIGDGKLLTNAHCVEHHTQVKVKRRGSDTKYVAKVLARGVECDIALLAVESKEFWKGAEPLDFGHMPRLQDSVTVVGYPLGGDTISVTKGVISRIEVTSYAHGSSELLGLQIDAAINPGNSGGPAFNDQGECIGIAFQVYRSEEAENIGYVIPTTVVSHFLDDYERHGKYTEKEAKVEVDTRGYYSINTLTVYNRQWVIKAIVLRRGLKDPYSNSNGSGYLWKIILMDMQGTTIQAIMFNEEIDRLDRWFIKGDTYLITNGIVKNVSPQFTSANKLIELTFNQDTQVEEAKTKITVDNLKYHFVQLKNIKCHSAGNKIIDVFGTVSKVEGIRSTTRSKMRNIIITNSSSENITLTLWADMATNEGKELEDLAHENPTIAATKVLVKTYAGTIFLATTSATTIHLNPCLPDNTEKEECTKEIEKEVAEKEEKQNDQGTEEIQIQDLITIPLANLKHTRCSFKGRMLKINNIEKPWYNACTSCKRKVIQTEHGMECTQCNNRNVSHEPRYLLKLTVSDGIHFILVTLFDAA